MALTDVPELKDLLKIENTASDGLLFVMRASAIALIETLIGRAILDPTGARTFGPVRNPYPILRGMRISDDAPNTRPVISGTDALGRTTGLPAQTAVLGAAPLSSLADYAWRWEPLINQAIRDTVSDFFNRRNAMVTAEAVGTGISTTYDHRADGLPARVRTLLQPIIDLGP